MSKLEDIEKVVIFMEFQNGEGYKMGLTKLKNDKIIFTVTINEKIKKKDKVELEKKFWDYALKIIEKQKLLKWKPGKTRGGILAFAEGYKLKLGSRIVENFWNKALENVSAPSELIEFIFSLKGKIKGMHDHHDHGGGCCGGEHGSKHEHKKESCEKKSCECEKDDCVKEKKEEKCCSENVECKCKNEEEKK